MPDLDQILAPAQSSPGTREVLEGKLVLTVDGAFARVDDRSALWGPLQNASGVADGATVLIAVSQHGVPWLVAKGDSDG
jgi:hypothetical protein